MKSTEFGTYSFRRIAKVAKCRVESQENSRASKPDAVDGISDHVPLEVLALIVGAEMASEVDVRELPSYCAELGAPEIVIRTRIRVVDTRRRSRSHCE
jgi:hypothetical protein